MLLAAHQRNPPGVSSHHRWTQVSTLLLVHDSKTQHSPALNPALRVFCCCCSFTESRNEARDAGLCNEDSDKQYPEVGAARRRRGGRAPAGALRRIHGDGETRSNRSHPPNHSAPRSHTPPPAPRAPHTTDRMHYYPCRGVRGCGGGCPSFSSSWISCPSPSLRALPPLQRQRS